MLESIIEKQSGQAFLLSKGDLIEVIDLEGRQVADLFAISAADKTDFFSVGHTLMMNCSLQITAGRRLCSTKYHSLLTVIKDDLGTHDLLVPCCRRESYAFLQSGSNPSCSTYHPNCLDNLNNSFEPFNIEPFPSIQALSIGLNASIGPDQRIIFGPNISKAGDSMILRAEMDLIVGVTACSDDQSACNNGHCTPIKVVIRKAPA